MNIFKFIFVFLTLCSFFNSYNCVYDPMFDRDIFREDELKYVVEAIENDQVIVLEDFLKKGLNVDAKIVFQRDDHKTEHTLLTFAVKNSAKNVISLLLCKNANINDFGTQIVDGNFSLLFTPLFVSLDKSQDILKLLLDSFANPDLAVKGNRKNIHLYKHISLYNVFDFYNLEIETKFLIINYLLKLNGKDLLTEALEAGAEINSIKELSRVAPITKEALEKAKALKVNAEIIKFLQEEIQYKIDFHDSFQTKIPSEVVDIIHCYAYHPIKKQDELLIHAIKEKNIFEIQNFINNNGNPNYTIEHTFENETEPRQVPLLMLALNFSSKQIAEYLINNNANLNLPETNSNKKSRCMPLFAALISPDITIDLVRKMLDLGANINLIYEKQNIKYNLAFILTQEISDEKKKFIHSFINGKFRYNILEFILKNKSIPLSLITYFVEELKAVVTVDCLELAQKNQNSEIIDYIKQERSAYAGCLTS